MKSIAMVALMMGLVVSLDSRPALGKDKPAKLTLTSVNVPFKTLAAVSASGTPSQVLYTFKSSSGPFCVQGFSINPGAAQPVGPGDAGTVFFQLNRIDGNGMSQDVLTLVDGPSGGFRPQDVNISYHSQICASSSLEFAATQFQASHGSGVEIQLFGTAIINAEFGNTVTVN